MAQSIKSGASGNVAKVDKNNRLHTFSVSRPANIQATLDGVSYNLNSGLVTLTSAGESGIIYFKNLEDSNFIVTSVVVILGPSTGGSTSDTTRVRVYKNVTAGTLVSTATAISVNSNRDFGSSNTLANSSIYSGAEGATITDGSVHIDSLVSPGSRAVFPIDEILRKGNSIAVSFEPNDSNTSMKVMCAVTGNLEVSTGES